MNRETKFDKACRLYVAIGSAETDMLNAALTYKRKKAGFTKRRAVALIAACLAFTLISTAMLAVGFYGNFGTGKDEMPDSTTDPSSAPTCFTATGIYATVDPRQIDLFDGTRKLVWENSEGYHLLNLNSERDYGKLLREVGKGDRVPYGESTEKLCRIWIAEGDGSVVSPCLSPVPGNVGYGELFDYQPEFEISGDFIDLASRLLGEQ